MPPFRFHHKLAATTGFEKFFVERLSIAEHDLVTARENQGGGHGAQIAEEGRCQRIFPVACIAVGKIIQQLDGHGRIVLTIKCIRRTGSGQVRPGGKGDDTAGLGQAQRPKLQAQTVTQTAAGAFSAETDTLRRIAFG